MCRIFYLFFLKTFFAKFRHETSLLLLEHKKKSLLLFTLKERLRREARNALEEGEQFSSAFARRAAFF